MRTWQAFRGAALGAVLLLFCVLQPAAAQGVPVTDGLVIRSNTVLKPGKYTMKDVNADGVIQITADNITLGLRRRQQRQVHDRAVRRDSANGSISSLRAETACEVSSLK